MSDITLQQKAGLCLKRLIKENYETQQDFADDYGLEIRTVNRYVNQGINQIGTVQELAEFFGIKFQDFFI